MDKETKERIEKEADAAAKKTYIHKTSAQLGYYKGYIAGATAERKRADQELAEYREENQKLKEALKELIPIAEEYEHMCYTADRFIERGREIKSIIEKVRKLIDK